MAEINQLISESSVKSTKSIEKIRKMATVKMISMLGGWPPVFTDELAML